LAKRWAQLEQLTQQNAALVEESAAAAESLKQQADDLVQSVSLFRVAERPLSHLRP
jgi:methyl-accepting chemotaxis protein